MVYTLLRTALAFLDSVGERYSHYPSANQRPIKSFLQITAIVLYLIALIAVISVLLQRSPTYFLTGVSAVTVLLMMVFRNTLFGFVASIQLAAYDMLRVGDWIKVPGFVADGTAIDIALNTIKVQNFDKSIVMLPRYVLLTHSVKHWRGMTESGARRVRHATGYGQDEDRQRSAQAGFLHHLVKPLVMQQLAGLLAGLQARRDG